jgi:hypothetical protein
LRRHRGDALRIRVRGSGKPDTDRVEQENLGFGERLAREILEARVRDVGREKADSVELGSHSVACPCCGHGQLQVCRRSSGIKRRLCAESSEKLASHMRSSRPGDQAVGKGSE